MMRLDLSAGFEVYSLAQRFDSLGSSGPVLGAYGRNSTNGARYSSGFAYLNDHPKFLRQNVQLKPTYILCGAFNFDVGSGQDSGTMLFAVIDSTKYQMQLRIDPSGHLYFVRGGNLNDSGTAAGAVILTPSSTNPVSQGAFHWIEWKILIDPSAGASEVRVDGTVFLTMTGINTRATTNSQIAAIQVGWDTEGSGSSDEGPNHQPQAYDFDDWAVVDTDSGITVDYPGNVRIIEMLPIANGDENDATPVGAGTNWQADAQNPLLRDDSSYDRYTAVGNIELYSAGNLPSGVGNVLAVGVEMDARAEAAGTNTIRNRIKSSGTVAESSDIAVDTSYAYRKDPTAIWEKDPHTNAAWLVSAVNALQFGTKKTA